MSTLSRRRDAARTASMQVQIQHAVTSPITLEDGTRLSQSYQDFINNPSLLSTLTPDQRYQLAAEPLMQGAAGGKGPLAPLWGNIQKVDPSATSRAIGAWQIQGQQNSAGGLSKLLGQVAPLVVDAGAAYLSGGALAGMMGTGAVAGDATAGAIAGGLGGMVNNQPILKSAAAGGAIGAGVGALGDTGTYVGTAPPTDVTTSALAPSGTPTTLGDTMVSSSGTSLVNSAIDTSSGLTSGSSTALGGVGSDLSLGSGGNGLSFGSVLQAGGLAQNLGGLLGGYLASPSSGQINQLAGIASPFSSQYAQYQPQLANLVNNPSSVTNTPGYQFGLNQGTEALARQFGAQGNYGSPGAAASIAAYGQNYAQRQYQTQLGDLMKLSGVGIGSPSAAAGIIGQQYQAGVQGGALLGQMGGSLLGGMLNSYGSSAGNYLSSLMTGG